MGSLGEHDACHVSCLPHAHNATLQDHTTASSCLPPGEPVGQCLLGKEMEEGDKANVLNRWLLHQQLCQRGRGEAI